MQAQQRLQIFARIELVLQPGRVSDVQRRCAQADIETRDRGRVPAQLACVRDNKPVELKGTFRPTEQSRLVPIFPRTHVSGRVDLVRDGNTVRASTRGVSEFTLLASPDMFDLMQPITVVANGRSVFNGRVQKSVETLIKWAARDNDRTMLFGAEIHVPLNDWMAIYGSANFITPAATGTVDAFLGVTFYPGGGARQMHRHRFAPLLPVAGNPSFAVDSQR